ncbi:hypothetical protein C1638_021380 [Chryseobacterium oncorhynchi]|uniref:Uncharacterized protein n=1 Tax=Chryseobacterium oncorhynchi TaxID=741074 RepID=A0A316WE10_9FLAO|nr:hypothetical protein C1638_021380 [Chryseobacterium oncorhynchi]
MGFILRYNPSNSTKGNPFPEDGQLTHFETTGALPDPQQDRKSCREIFSQDISCRIPEFYSLFLTRNSTGGILFRKMASSPILEPPERFRIYTNTGRAAGKF